MKNKIKQLINNTSLAVKIRLSYLVLCVQLVLIIVFCIYAMEKSTRQFDEMISSASTAGDFSIDFKKDYDYETYLLIVGNKTPEESLLNKLLEDANNVVDGLEIVTTADENRTRLTSVKKYLANLEKYKKRIENNLLEDDKYDDNMQIWENDVQIVTSLIREEVFNYIFYEIRDMETARENMTSFYFGLINVALIVFLIIVVGVIVFSYYLPLSITKPIRELVKVTDKVSKGDLTVRSDVETGSEVGELSKSLNQMIDKINELLSQITREQVRIREAELELLQSQINPHFLYNTLDTIVWLAEGGYQKEVVSMVKSLSAFFRTSISRGKEIITVGEEIIHARSYLEIQRFRYQDILEYDIACMDCVEKYLIPKITLQPLIENALYHGIKNKRGGGRITVSVEVNENDFAILISDNGIGMSEERLQQVIEGIESKTPSDKKIYGLYNVNERIKLKFGPQYGLKITSVEGEGTISKIVLPKGDANSIEEKNQLYEEKN